MSPTQKVVNTKINSRSDEMVLRDVLDRWKGAIDAHEPQHVAATFTSDAIFQGLHPYGVGRKAVAEYYDSQPSDWQRTIRFSKPGDLPTTWFSVI
jgi:hypothetical protein